MLRSSINPEKATSKWLSIILGVSALITLTHAAVTNSKESQNKCREKCYTDKCTDEALNLIKFIKNDADPCEDFYEFACGTYLKNTKLGATDTETSPLVDVQSSISTNVLTDLYQEEEDDWDAIKKMKIYLKNCLDTERTEQDGFRPLERYLNAIGGWPVVLGNRWNEQSFDLWQTLYKIPALKVPSFFPMVITIDGDNVDVTKFAINVGIASLSVNAAWFTDKSDPNKVSRIYTNMMLQAATKLGARNDSTTLRELQAVTDFEINLFKISTPAEKLIALPIEYFRMTIRQLMRKSPGINWFELINRTLRPSSMSVNEDEIIYVIDPKFTIEVSNLIRRTPKRVLANFIAWKMTQKFLPHMPEELRSVGDEFANVVEGTAAGRDKTTSCFNEVQQLFPIALGAMYINKHFKEPIKAEIVAMFENLRSVAYKMLQENDWMDYSTKRLALEKLNAMTVTVGFDKELRDERKVNQYYEELEIRPGSNLDSWFNVTSFSERLQQRNLGKLATEGRWKRKPNLVELNAYNAPNFNSIELPAGFLKYLFILNRPKYMNYGITGTFIGHEIFHGFDNQGKKYDKVGNQVNWWQPQAEEEFRNKAQCIIDQYNNFTVPEVNMKVNGELSQGENIADNGGFRASYLAYKEWTKRHNTVEGCLPSLNYTPEQMFWISSASIWCAKKRPEYVRAIIATNEHSPNIARVNIVFSNIKEFAQDFNCKLGTKMNPYNKCKVW